MVFREIQCPRQSDSVKLPLNLLHGPRVTSGQAVIRDLGRADLGSLLSLYNHLHEQDDAPPDRRRIEAIWEGIVRDPAQIYLGGFVDESLVSACNAAIVPNLTRGARPYAVIENVVTHASYRRQGIGAGVLRALVECCWAHGCYKVMLMSAVRRAQIHGFYEALGFDKNSKQAFVITRR
jgi:GNAT superfamily N-acetyltransferase